MNRFAQSMCILACLAGIAIGADVVVRYPSDPTATSGELDAMSSADVGPLDSSDYANRPIIQLNHNQTLSVSAGCTTAGATASVGIIRGRMVGTTFKPSRSCDGDWATLTADSTYKVGSNYATKSVDFDTANAEAAMLYLRSISAGSATIGWRVH